MNRMQGTCFGYAIHAQAPLHYLRSGRGAPLYVLGGSRPRSAWPVVREWKRPHAPFDGRLHASDPWHFGLEIEGAGWYEIDTASPCIRVPDGDPLRVEERTWGLPVLLCFLARGDMALHAAALEVGREAILVAAPGRHGKSTLATAWAARGGQVLSEDLARVQFRPGTVQVIPGPAMLRPRRDVADAVLGSSLVEYGRDDERVHLGLPVPRRGTCAPRRVSGIVLLREGREVATSPCPPSDAIRDLWALSFNLSTDEDRERCFTHLTTLVTRVPVWNLARPLRLDSLPSTIDVLDDMRSWLRQGQVSETDPAPRATAAR